MHHSEVKALAVAVAPIIREHIDKTITPLRTQLDELSARALIKGDAGEHGIDGAPGKDGKDADPAAVAALITTEVEKAVSAIPRPADGKSVTVDDVRPVLEELVAAIPPAKDGKDADPQAIAALVAVEVEKAVAALPAPADEKSVTVDDVRPVIEELVAKIPPAQDGKDADPQAVAALVTAEVEKAVASLPKPADGKSVTVDDVRPVIEDAVAKIPAAKDGRDGLQADECLVPDDLAINVGKAIALLAESPALASKSMQPIVVNVIQPPAKPTSFKMQRAKDGTVDVRSQD